jgi:hypothetical protein
MPKLDIDRMLTCTTAHITDADNMYLHNAARENGEAPDTSEHFVADFGYGYAIWVNTDGDFTEYKGKMSDAFLGLLGFAFNQGVQFLRLDRDAGEIDGLPLFDW